MKKVGIISFKLALCIIVLLMTYTPSIAGDFTKKGTIHLVPGYWGPNDGTAAPSNATFMLALYPLNRGEKNIKYHINFYDTGGELVARLPETGRYSLVPHGGMPYVTSGLLASQVGVNAILYPVLIWSGNVNVAPTCGISGFVNNSDGGLISQVYETCYDDSVK